MIFDSKMLHCTKTIDNLCGAYKLRISGRENRPPNLLAAQRPNREALTMAINFEDYTKFSKEQLESVQAAAAEVSKQLQAIAAETTEYSKKSVESGSAFVEKLLGVKKLDEAIALQQEFAKTSYEGFVAQTTKLGELYANVAKVAFKPVEGAIAKVKASAN